MDLTEFQRDALAELINIGYGRAAGALSELTGHRVSVDVPGVKIHRLDQIGAILENTLSSQVANVNQKFSGPISGKAVLVMNEASAVVLSRLLGDDRPVPHDFDANAKEIVREIGNILLQSCLGVFGNLLQIHLGFSVPRLEVEHVKHVLHGDLDKSDDSSTHGLLIHTRFHVATADINGYLVIVLGIASFDRLMVELKQWEERQLHT